MAETTQTEARNATVLNSYVGTVDAGSVEARKDKKGNDYLVAKMTVHGPDKEVDLYVRGAMMEVFLAKVEAGGQIFAQGEIIAKGKGLSVTNLEPKTYEATIVKIHGTGTNEFGDWTSARLAIDGMAKERNALLGGADAHAANAAGEGGKISFKGAWKPEKNENNTWYTKLVSASSLEPRISEEPSPTP